MGAADIRGLEHPPWSQEEIIIFLKQLLSKNEQSLISYAWTEYLSVNFIENRNLTHHCLNYFMLPCASHCERLLKSFWLHQIIETKCLNCVCVVDPGWAMRSQTEPVYCWSWVIQNVRIHILFAAGLPMNKPVRSYLWIIYFQSCSLKLQHAFLDLKQLNSFRM